MIKIPRQLTVQYRGRNWSPGSCAHWLKRSPTRPALRHCRAIIQRSHEPQYNNMAYISLLKFKNTQLCIKFVMSISFVFSLSRSNIATILDNSYSSRKSLVYKGSTNGTVSMCFLPFVLSTLDIKTNILIRIQT